MVAARSKAKAKPQPRESTGTTTIRSTSFRAVALCHWFTRTRTTHACTRFPYARTCTTFMLHLSKTPHTLRSVSPWHLLSSVCNWLLLSLVHMSTCQFICTRCPYTCTRTHIHIRRRMRMYTRNPHIPHHFVLFLPWYLLIYFSNWSLSHLSTCHFPPSAVYDSCLPRCHVHLCALWTLPCFVTYHFSCSSTCLTCNHRSLTHTDAPSSSPTLPSPCSNRLPSTLAFLSNSVFLVSPRSCLFAASFCHHVFCTAIHPYTWNLSSGCSWAPGLWL